jgi:hypothetical protein
LQSNFQVQTTEKVSFEANDGSKKKSFAILFNDINALKKQLNPEKTASSKKRTRKAESFLCSEINITTSSDEGENKDCSYFF